MKKIRIAINGFGRIGRLVFRALHESTKHKDAFEVVAINDLSSVETQAHLLKYDSIHGHFFPDISNQENYLVVDGQKISFFSKPNPQELPWKSLGIDIVFECSGHFTEREKAQLHLKAGAQKVLISAPAKGEDKTIVFGVNHTTLTNQDLIVSNASCTTNCLAPLAFVLDKKIGIEKGHMTTIHAYTADQRLVDSEHKDLHRARAAALSMIPTSTGAAKAIGLVLPRLKGKLDGTAIRVPTPNVSFVDFTFLSSQPTTKEEINHLFMQAAQNELEHIVDLVTAPLVSVDFNHSAFSSHVDLSQTTVLEGNLCRVAAWYDNEWGFSNRMLDTAYWMEKKT